MFEKNGFRTNNFYGFLLRLIFLDYIAYLLTIIAVKLGQLDEERV